MLDVGCCDLYARRMGSAKRYERQPQLVGTAYYFSGMGDPIAALTKQGVLVRSSPCSIFNWDTFEWDTVDYGTYIFIEPRTITIPYPAVTKTYNFATVVTAQELETHYAEVAPDA